MTAPHLDSVQKIATLAKLTIAGLPVQRVQNWCREDYFYRGEPYRFANFDGTPIATRQIDFANNEATVTLGNRSAKDDALRPLREWLRAHDGWRRARVEVIQLWPEDPAAPPYVNRLQVLASDLQEGRIDLTLRSPVEAVNAIIPSVHVSNSLIRELPMVQSGHLF